MTLPPQKNMPVTLLGNTITIFVPIAARVLISTYLSNIDIISHKIINHIGPTHTLILMILIHNIELVFDRNRKNMIFEHLIFPCFCFVFCFFFFLFFAFVFLLLFLFFCFCFCFLFFNLVHR